MGTHVTTIRLPEQLADDAQLIAKLDGISFAKLVETAVEAHVKLRGLDPKLRGRLETLIEKEKSVLDGLVRVGD